MRAPGFTFYIAFGKWSGFHIILDGPALRFILGFVAICFMRMDIEVMANNCLKILEAYKKTKTQPCQASDQVK